MGRRGHPIVVTTDIPGLVLRQHVPDDADPYYDLVQANREHLTRFSGYEDEVARSRTDIERRLHEPDESLRFGIWHQDELVGHISLLHQDPPCWGLGYWLSEHATGRGFMTAAASALLRFAKQSLSATEIRAAVTHGNDKSAAVLARLGFTDVADRPTHGSYVLHLAGSSD